MCKGYVTKNQTWINLERNWKICKVCCLDDVGAYFEHMLEASDFNFVCLCIDIHRIYHKRTKWINSKLQNNFVWVVGLYMVAYWSVQATLKVMGKLWFYQTRYVTQFIHLHLPFLIHILSIINVITCTWYYTLTVLIIASSNYLFIILLFTPDD